ncbi:MAG: pentapeptide repeat-containing protein [Deltaproteobacteria bacterium]|nr:pentapeptide repeat-containing protein [Deltaproteobacteria bacterium]
MGDQERENSPDPGKDFRKGNLKGHDFRKQDLTGADFTKAKLAGADFTDADLSGAVFAGADLSGAILTGARAEGADFTGANFQKTVMGGLKAARADFSRASFRNVEAEDVDLTGAKFVGASLSRCVLTKARFVETTTDEANFFRSRFDSCVFDSCSMKSMKAPATRFEKTEVRRCDFLSSDLLSLYTSETTIEACAFATADMAGMLSVQSRWRNCDFSGAELTASEFKECSFEGGSFAKSNFRYVAGLSEEQLAAVKEAGGRVSRYLFRRALKWVFLTNIGRLSFAVVVVASVASASMYYKNPANWSKEKLWERAGNAANEDRLENAIQYYEALVEKLPDGSDQMPDAKAGLAKLYIRSSQIDKAEALIENLLNDELVLPSVRLDAMTMLGETRIRRGEYDGIRTLVGKILELPAQEDSILFSVTHINNELIPRQQFTLVRTIVDDCLEKFEGNIKAQSALLFSRAHAFLGANKPDDAIADLELLNTMDIPSETRMEILTTLGGAFQAKRELDKALGYFNDLITKYPEATDKIFQARLNIAHILREKGRREEAMAIYQKLAEESENHDQKAQAANALAGLQAELGRHGEAEKILEGLLSDSGADERTRMGTVVDLARNLQAQGNTREALKLINKNIKETADPTLLRLLRESRMDLNSVNGDIDVAVKDGEYLLSQATEPWSINSYRTRLAALYERKGRLEDAVKTLAPLLTQSTNEDTLLQAYQQIFEINLHMNQRDRAKEIAEELVKLKDMPSLNLTGVMLLAELYAQDGDMEKAHEYLQQVMTMPVPARLPERAVSAMNLGMNDALRDDAIAIYEYFLSEIGQTGDPDSVWMTRLYLGHLVAQKGDFEGARKLYLSVFDNAANAGIQQQGGESLGNLLANNQLLDEAEQVYRSILKRWPEQQVTKMNAQIGLAQVENYRGRHDAAIKILADLAPACVDDNICCRIQSDLANFYRQLGDTDGLTKTYKTVVSRYPECWIAEEARAALNQ